MLQKVFFVHFSHSTLLVFPSSHIFLFSYPLFPDFHRPRLLPFGFPHIHNINNFFFHLFCCRPLPFASAHTHLRSNFSFGLYRSTLLAISSPHIFLSSYLSFLDFHRPRLLQFDFPHIHNIINFFLDLYCIRPLPFASAHTHVRSHFCS